MYDVWHRDNPRKPLRKQRTKDGCVTCKRRKVRCNLERPCCSHCLRLQLDCLWSKPSSTPAAASTATAQDAVASGVTAAQPTSREPSSARPSPPTQSRVRRDSSLDQSQTQPEQVPLAQQEQQQQAQHLPEVPVLSTPTSEPAATGSGCDRGLTIEKTFDFASFLWDPTAFNTTLPDVPTNQRVPTTHSLPVFGETPGSDVEGSTGAHVYQDSTPDHHRYSTSQLIEHFKLSDAPPLLAPMETRASWYLMRNQILSMVSVSPMVCYAVLAFSALQLQNSKSHSSSSTFGLYYTRSQEGITTSALEIHADPSATSSRAWYVLAALFLVSYIDLVTNQTGSAHVNLRMAYDIITSLDKENLTFAELRLIFWFRLLDGRAVSAGGEGLFLREDSDAYSLSTGQSPTENDAEATLSEMLSKPALNLFQKTQSYMGRITQIDQWHRARGTVEDETEVMDIALEIRRDYRTLYQQRHPILNQAISGSVSSPLLSVSLAASVMCKCRIAIANYHAIPIHLHRVAYRHLPWSKDVENSVKALRRLTHEMGDALPDGDALPVNMLWPLLMWGSEEDNADQRDWIIKTIRQMANSVSNAEVTADVLGELWRRQDRSGQRQDIRTVMHQTLNSCFAIV